MAAWAGAEAAIRSTWIATAQSVPHGVVESIGWIPGAETGGADGVIGEALTRRSQEMVNQVRLATPAAMVPTPGSSRYQLPLQPAVDLLGVEDQPPGLRCSNGAAAADQGAPGTTQRKRAIDHVVPPLAPSPGWRP